MQWPCMQISESAKTPRAMRTVRRLSALQAPTANAPHYLYTQCASSDSIGPLPDTFAASQSLRMHTHIELSLLCYEHMYSDLFNALLYSVRV